ncbi:MAG: hypothetical protein MSA09_06485 [Lachnospiraceae bacterium]|nr:hypothetical protein [Lachnospiraceae bacterium]MDD7176976.1 hypothetical protein [bacterium]MDY5516178.1 hypothetical protein [Lachnospiraceae bacterium]
MFNPAMIFQVKNMWDRFQKNHPKFPRFLQVVGSECMQVGTVIEISVTKADGENITSNIKLNEEDMELISAIQNMSRQA